LIHRVAYRANKPNKLLLTGSWANEESVEPFSIEYDLETNKQYYIEVEAESAYKPTIYGKEIIVAEKSVKTMKEVRFGSSDQNPEACRIRRMESFKRIPCRIANRIKNDLSETNIFTSKKCSCRLSDAETSASRTAASGRATFLPGMC
jgi:hypothetical protein